jgi:hypothetical protein
MRVLLSLLVCFFAVSAHADKFSDLSVKDRHRIIIGLQDFLPDYRQALEIVLYNIENRMVGTMDVNAQMQDLTLSSGSAQELFEKVEDMFDGKQFSLKGLSMQRDTQTIAQLRAEIKQAYALGRHISVRPWDEKKWVAWLDNQLSVVLVQSGHTTVALRNFPRANCNIMANDHMSVKQACQ